MFPPHIASALLIAVHIFSSTCNGIHRAGKVAVDAGKWNAKDDFFSQDGVLNLESYVHFVVKCGTTSSQKELFKREFQKFAKDCGIDIRQISRKKRMLLDPFKIACATACLHVKIQEIARDMFIATAVAPLKPGGHSRNDFDHDIVKQMATEVGFCTKIAPSYNVNNCYSALPFASCSFFGVISACSLGPS